MAKVKNNTAGEGGDSDVVALREALAFYANPSSWDKDDWGVRSVIAPPDYGTPGFTARQALGLPEPAEED